MTTTALELFLRKHSDRPDWFDQAACRNHPEPNLWFRDTKRRQVVLDADTTKAVRICNGCPVRMLCLDHAIATHELIGVWGGMTCEQRRFGAT